MHINARKPGLHRHATRHSIKHRARQQHPRLPHLGWISGKYRFFLRRDLMEQQHFTIPLNTYIIVSCVPPHNPKRNLATLHTEWHKITLRLTRSPYEECATSGNTRLSGFSSFCFLVAFLWISKNFEWLGPGKGKRKGNMFLFFAIDWLCCHGKIGKGSSQ